MKRNAKEFALLDEQVKQLAAALVEQPITSVYITACGGSLATISPGKYLLDRFTAKVRSSVHNANEFMLDTPVAVDAQSLVIVNSQSGNTTETVTAAKIAQEKGARIVAFSTNIESQLCELADFPIYYYDNPEDPYPLGLSIFPIVYKTIFGIIDALEGSTYSVDLQAALDKIDTIVDTNWAIHEAKAKAFAQLMLPETLIYTAGTGINHDIAYIVSNCLVMESLWLDSSALHGGEFFHGAVEAFDESSAVFALVGLGNNRPTEERVVKFLQRKTEKLVTLDAKSFDWTYVAEWLQPQLAPIILNFIAAKYCDELSYLKGHPISSRRYMGIEKY